MEGALNIVLLGDSAKNGIAYNYVKRNSIASSQELSLERTLVVENEVVKISLKCEGPTFLEKKDAEVSGFILVYTVSSKVSFSAACSFLDILQQKENKPPVLLLGCTTDENREVSLQNAQSFALEKFCSHAEVSLNSDENIEASINKFVERVHLNRTPTLSKSLPVYKKAPPLQPRSSSLLSLFQRKKINLPETDTWTSLKSTPKEWTSEEIPETDSLIDFSGRASGFHFETGGRKALTHDDIRLEFHDKHTPFYNMLYYGKDHHNYVGTSQTLGNIVVSFESTDKNSSNRVLVRTKKGDSRVLVPAGVKSPKDVLKHIKTNVTDINEVKLKPVVNTPSVDELLSDFENKEKVSHYKFGVLYVKEGQTDEDEIYSNTEMSQDFEDFLGILGQKIELLGFTGYGEGLDTKYGTTGKHSIYTKYEDLDIMYHVAPFLPFQDHDPQRVERKRHLGNDVVLIVFKEGNEPFDPQIIHSHFNHVFVVVQIHQKTAEKTSYRVAVATKSGVESFGPALPPQGIFEDKQLFRRFLLTKIINGERASMNGGEFRSALIRTRNLMLSELTQKVNNRKRPSSGTFLGVPLIQAFKMDKEDRRKSMPNM